MGWFTHFLVFGVGVYVGTTITQPPAQAIKGEPWIRINSGGVKMGTRDVVKITDHRIDFWDGILHIDRNKD